MLRPYQLQLKQDIYQALRSHERVLAQLPTGGGKTVIIVQICLDAIAKERSVLIVVHRVELVEQTLEKLRTYGLGKYISKHIYVTMVQTRKPQPLVDLVIIDEAHHATATTYQAILESQKKAKVIGLTATPCRTDGRGLGDVFTALVQGSTVKELVADGFLVPTHLYAVPLKTVNVKTSMGDYNKRDLAEFMAREVLYGDVVKSYKDLTPNGKVILYASSVELSKSYAKEYNDSGISAAHIDGTTPSNERRRIIEQFRSGAIRVLSNYSLITEGFDVPDCDVIQLVRPTKSLGLYLQMVGRGMRPSVEKVHCTILDHAACTLTHGFANDIRLWTLEGKKKRVRDELPEMVEVELDLGETGRAEKTHLKYYTLERVERDPLLYLADDLKITAELKGYKPGWVFHQWIQRIPNPTLAQLQRFAKTMGYHHKWAQHQFSLLYANQQMDNK